MICLHLTDSLFRSGVGVDVYEFLKKKNTVFYGSDCTNSCEIATSLNILHFLVMSGRFKVKISLQPEHLNDIQVI